MRTLFALVALLISVAISQPTYAQPASGYIEADQAVQDCAFEMPNGMQRFAACFNDDVLSPDQKRVITCTVNLPYPGYAPFCAAGIVLNDQQRAALDCAVQSKNYQAAAANCLTGFVSPEVGQAVQCLYQTNQNLWETAICMGGERLTPEQQVVVSCAVQTGGQPYAFAGCVGTQLTVNELQKCFTSGIGGAGGCFGPNNTMVKFVHNAWHDVTHSPGQGNEVVKFFKKPLGDHCSFFHTPGGCHRH